MVVRIAFLLLIAVPLTHQDQPEVAIDGNQEQFITEGEKFTLICRYNASPPVSEVQWIKDGNVITINATVTNNGSRVTKIFYNESLSQLSITSASSQNSGNYTCNVTNNVTDTTDSTSIVIQEKPSTKLQPETVTVKEGENVTLFCNSSGSSLTITWKFNGSDVTTSGDSRISFSDSNRNLIITNVSRVNKGEYKCVASNEVGNDTSNTTFLLVEFGPEISQPPTNRTKEEKQTVDFSCVVAGYPTPDVVWTKNGLELNVTGDMRLSVSSNDGDHQLNISNVQQSDAGQYRCVANNSLDTATSSSATLTVQFAPEVTIDGDQKRYLANGTDLLLTCQFNALPTVSEVQWVKDGIVIASTLITPSNGSRVTISHHNESQTQLSIIAVSLEDAGNYTCNVTNNVGSSSSNWTSIVIQVTPSIEQDPKASPVKERENLTLFCNASGSSLRISWEKNGSGINPSEDSRILLSRDNVQLTIVNVSRKDNGAYQCVASNEVGSATSNAAIVNVQFGPEISEPPINTTKIEGQTVVLSCLVAGYPTPAVAWTKNDVELNSIPNLRLSVSSKNGNHTLKITDVQKSDAGQYRCVANNSLQTSKSSPSTLTVQFAPEVTIDGDQIHYVANSTDLQLTCRFNALPPASEVQWLNNGNVIASTLSVPSNGSRATISHHNESQAQLLITTVSLEDAGNYTCNVTNVVGSSSNWTLIIIQVTPAIETHPQADPVKEGENLTFFCNATGSSLTISWTKNRSSINPNEDVRIRLSTDKEHLTIRNVSRKDNGAYRCVASNKVGNATSNAAIVTVRFAPEISQSPRDTTEVEGQTAVFNCVVAGYPTPDVAWEKNGVELNVAEHARLRVSSNDGNHRLIISNVQQSDAGQYKCVANNSLDTVTSSSATLTVHFDPEVTIDGDKEKIVAKGDDIKVTCRHKALPPVSEVQWIKDGKVISTNSTKVINNSRLDILHFNESLIQLSISAAIVADSGNYTCNVTNMVNSSSDSTSIIVEVKPSILTQPKSAAPKEGDTIKLYCNATGSPILHISWTFDGSVITANENSRISLSNDSQELTITNVKRGNSGDYRCLVKNRVGNDTSDTSVINVLYQPEIITHPKNVTVEEGLRMTLFCNATGNPPPTLSWTKDGSPINDTQGITFSGDNETLSIASINRSESGNYRCVARNGLENDLSNPAKVDVQFAPEIVENPKDVTIVEGEDVVFSCTVDGNPSPRVTWTKNEEKLNTTTNLQLTTSSLNNNNSLTITNVHRSDSGQYRCVIINSVGNITSSPGDLNVQFPPEFISSPQNVTVIEEQNANLTLNCTVYGNPTPDVKWTKDGIDISENQRINVSDFKGNTSSLTITNIVRGDEGQYRCVAINSVNTTISAPGKLTVNFRADVKISGSEEKYVEINKQIYLMCQYNASPPVSEVQWVKDGSVIARNDSGIGNRLVNITEFTESQSHLLISSSTRDDEGNYTCFVTNAVGNSSDITSVLIQVVPDPPHTLTVDFKGSRVVNISWKAGFYGNSAIKNYTVEISEDNQIFNDTVCQGSLSSSACVVSSSPTTASLLGLFPWTTYNIRVFATNKIGRSNNSPILNVTTDEEVPSEAPTFVVTVLNSTAVNVSWQMLSKDKARGAILGYYVLHRVRNTPPWENETIDEPGATSLLVEPLNEHTTYEFAMQAFNGKGVSKLSALVEKTTDQHKPSGPPEQVTLGDVTSTSIKVTWAPVKFKDRNGIIKGYKVIYRALPNGNNVTKFLNISKENQDQAEQTLKLERLNEFTNYSIRVLAFTAVGDGPLSVAQVKQTLEDKPSGLPQQVTLGDVTSTSINVTWAPIKFEDQNGIIKGYKVIYRALPNGTNVTKVADAENALTIGGLNEFTNYSIRVLAFTAVGDGPLSVAQVKQTLEDKPSDPPQQVTLGDVTSTSIKVTWAPVKFEDRNGIIKGYKVIYRALPNGTNVTKVVNTENALTIGGLNEFTNYSIRVLAFTAVGDGPLSVTQVKQTLEDKPSGPPRNVDVNSTTSTSILVTWDEVLPDLQNGIIRSYNVSYQAVAEAGSAGPIYLTKVKAPTRQVNLTGLTKDMHYNVSVLASTIKGDGNYSNPKTFRTNEDRPSGPPQRVQGDFTSSTSIMVKWDVVREDQQHGEIISYTVRYKKLTDGTYKDKEVTSRSYELKRLDKYTVYKIEVLASTRIGNGPPSEPIEERTDQDKPEGPPQSVTVTTVDSSSIKVTWKPVLQKFRHGVFTQYIILYNYSSEGNPLEHNVSGKVEEAVVGGLKQSTKYTIRVLAATVKGRGPPSSPKSATTEDPPKPPEPGEGDVGKTEVNIPFVPKQELSDGAPVTKYQVIVMELTDGQDEGKSSDPKYAKVTRKYEDRVAGEPYVTAEFANNNEKRTSFPVGDGKYYSTEGVTDAKRKRREVVEKFLNGKLDDGAKYVAFQRSFDKEGDYESEGFVDFETNKDHTVTIVVVVVLLVIITACIAVGIFVYRRRQSSPRNGEEEMALRPQKRGRTLSKRILGRASGAFDNPAHNPGEAVPVEEFEEHVRRLHANGDLLFSQEYGALKPQAEFTWNATLAQENRHKNRYNNVVAYDHSRVKLSHIQGVPGSDYINANFLEGYQKKRAYIASQGPLPETEDDFWRMIWEQDSKIIVMVTNLEERGRIKCHQYWPSEGGKAYGDIQVTLMQIVELSDFTIRTFTLKKANSRSERTLHQYHYTVWPDHGVPSCPTSLLTFVKKASGANPADAGPMVVHCSAGVGRTGTFIVVDAMLQSIAAEKTVDVFGYVMTLRRDRNIMVQVEEQYVFIHEVLLEAIHSGYTEIRANDLRSHMKLLMQVSPSTGQTEMDEEFIRLGRGNTPQTKFQAANMGYNKTKNRYANVLAFDDTRVKLSMITGIEGSDYINANFIDGYMTRRAFIATQAPIPDTIPDFWRMIWEQESSTIVMLSKETESGKVKVHRYWPAKQPASIGTLVVEMTNEMVYEDYTMREIKLTNTKESASRVVRQYHYTGWPDVGSPESGTGLIDLIGQVQRWQQNSGNTTITVHCSAGVGRTGVFCALSILIERLKSEGVVDVFQTVKQLRAQRPAMVQTKDQYEFIYSALSEYLDSFDAYSNFE